MSILLLNAGSSSLKAAVMDADSGQMLFEALTDWAGPTTRYRFGTQKDRQSWETVSWTGPARAVERFARDLNRAELNCPAICPLSRNVRRFSSLIG